MPFPEGEGRWRGLRCPQSRPIHWLRRGPPPHSGQDPQPELLSGAGARPGVGPPSSDRRLLGLTQVRGKWKQSGVRAVKETRPVTLSQRPEMGQRDRLPSACAASRPWTQWPSRPLSESAPVTPGPGL